MTGTDWTVVIGAITALIVAIGKGMGWVIDTMMRQARDTIRELEEDRDYWRTRAIGEDGPRTPPR